MNPHPLWLRIMVALGANVVFLTLNHFANHTLAPLGIHLFWGAALVLFPALRLPLTAGLTVTFISITFLFSSLPPEVTLLGVPFLLAHVFLWRFKEVFQKDPWLKKMTVVLILNIVVLAGLIGYGFLQSGSAWPSFFLRGGVDFLLSNLLFPLILIWFWKGQKACLFLYENMVDPRIPGTIKRSGPFSIG